MYTRDTVFILGAGASWHYGYPTGEMLIEKIIAKAEEFEHQMLGKDGRTLYGGNAPSGYIDRPKPAPWYSHMGEDCKKLAERLSTHNPLVIDYFLGHNAKLKEIGTLMIAWVILDHELKNRQSNHNRDDDHSVKDLEVREKLWRRQDDWIKFIIHEMLSGCESIEDLMRNKVQFITFNYDVSLENHLYKRLSQVNLFQADGEKIKTFIKERVHHVYGQVRDDFENDLQFEQRKSFGGTEYDELITHYNAAYLAAGQLKTIEPHNKAIDKDASEIISKAQDFYILGYGFDKNNNERLKLGDIVKEDLVENQRRIFWTNYGNSNKINKIVAQMWSLNYSDLRKNNEIPVSKRKVYTSFSNLSDGQSTITYVQSQFEQSIKSTFDALANDFD